MSVSYQMRNVNEPSNSYKDSSSRSDAINDAEPNSVTEPCASDVQALGLSPKRQAE